MAEEIEEQGIAGKKFSRRTLVKGGAIVGATLWVAPMVESFASPASAASSNSGCFVCFSGGLDGSGAPTGQAFFAGQDNPGPAEAISTCTTQGTKVPAANGGPITSGSYILFNTTDPNGFWSTTVINYTSAACSYGVLPSKTANELNNSCPAAYTGGGAPTSVTCQTGTW